MASFDGTIKINTKIDQSGVDKGLSEMTSSCTSFASTVGAIFAGIGVFEFGRSALKSTADIELAQVKLETLLGSADRAQAMIADIIKMADTTPYNSNDLIEAATTLKTFGVSASEIMPTLTALGNAAGGQADKLKGVAMALGQTAAQGKMMTQDLYQFINAGVPLLDLLAKRLNKSKGEIKGMIEEGKIGYAEVNGALQEFYTGNGKYADLMAKAAQTLPGLWSSFQDSVSSLGRALVAIFEGQIKGALQTAISFFQGLTGAINNLSQPAKNILASFGGAIAIFTALAVAIGVASSAFSALFIVLRANPFMLIISLIGTMIIKLMDLGDAAQDNMGLQPAEAERAIKTYEKLIQKQDEAIKSAERAGDTAGVIAGYQRVEEALQYNIDKLKDLNPASAEWLQTVSQAAAQAKFLQTSKTLGFISQDDILKADELAAKFEMLYKAKRRAAQDTGGAGGDGGSDTAAADKAAADKRQAIWDAYYSWKIGETEGELAKEEYSINRAADKDLIIAGSDGKLRAAIEEKRGADILAAREKWAKKHEIAAWLMGRGSTEKEAEGIESGVFFVIDAVKHTFEAIAQTAAVMGEIFSGAINLADWMVAFDPATLYDDFKKYIEGLADFFENDLGSIPIFFDQGVAVFEKFLAGMTSNLPAIVETLGAVIDKIVGYIATNAGTIIDQVVTIVVALAQVIVSKLPAIFAAAFQAVVSLLGKIAEVAPDLIKTLFDAVGQMIIYIGQHAGELIRSLVDVLVAVFVGVAENIDKIVEPLGEAAPQIAVALMADLPAELIKESPSIIQAILIGTLKALPALVKGLTIGMFDAGKDVIQGLIKGILSVGDIWGAVKRVFVNLLKTVKQFFGIHSPSTVFMSIGVDIIRGLVLGIISMGYTILPAFVSCFATVWSWTSTIISKFLTFGKNLIAALISGINESGADIWKNLWWLITGALKYITESMNKVFKNFGTGLANSLMEGLKSGLSGLGSIVSALGGGGGGGGGIIGTVVGGAIGGAIGGVGGAIGGALGFANGTDSAPGGMALVGERGAELVNLPKGSSVLTASKTMALLSALNNFNAAPLAASAGGGSFSFDISAADVKIDGDMVGQVVFKRIDKIVRNAYGVRQ